MREGRRLLVEHAVAIGIAIDREDIVHAVGVVRHHAGIGGAKGDDAAASADDRRARHPGARHAAWPQAQTRGAAAADVDAEDVGQPVDVGRVELEDAAEDHVASVAAEGGLDVRRGAGRQAAECGRSPPSHRFAPTGVASRSGPARRTARRRRRRGRAGRCPRGRCRRRRRGSWPATGRGRNGHPRSAPARTIPSGAGRDRRPAHPRR